MIDAGDLLVRFADALLRSVALDPEKIVIGLINGNYAFSHIKASAKFRDANKSYTFDAEEAYLDQNSSLLFIRKLKAPFVGQEVMINTKNLKFIISKSENQILKH